MSDTWTAIWITGALRQERCMWRHWHDCVRSYCVENGLELTNFGASSPSFKPGKYRNLRYSRKRLLRALDTGEDFQWLSFINAPKPHQTTIGATRSRFFLSAAGRASAAEASCEIRNEFYPATIVEHFQPLVSSYFREGRVITFTSNDLPCNFMANYDNLNVRHRVVAAYPNIHISHFDTETETQQSDAH